MSVRERFVCPKCKRREGVRIVYGDFDPDALASIRGDFVLGGGCVPVDGPERECSACGHQWRIRRSPRKDSRANA